MGLAAGSFVCGGVSGEAWVASSGGLEGSGTGVAGGERREFVGGGCGQDTRGDCPGEVVEGAWLECERLVARLRAGWAGCGEGRRGGRKAGSSLCSG